MLNVGYATSSSQAFAMQRHCRAMQNALTRTCGTSVVSLLIGKSTLMYKWRASHQGDILCCIVDSMDKSKFRLPRFANSRCPKALETKKRPECEVTAAIVHGIGIFVFLADSEQSTGSDWSLEILSRSLEKAFQVSQQKGQPWPSHLRFWSDNTPKDPWQRSKCCQKLCLRSFGTASWVSGAATCAPPAPS